MAATHDRLLQAARAAKKLANEAHQLFWEAQALRGFHVSNGLVGAGTDPRPDYVRLDVAGNLDGVDFTPADYIALMNFLDQLSAFVAGGTPVPGNYRDVVNRLADA